MTAIKHILLLTFSFLFIFRSPCQIPSKKSTYPKIIYLKKKFYFASNPTDRINSQAVLVYAEGLSEEKNSIDLKKLVIKTKRNLYREAAFGTGGIVTMGLGLAAAGIGLASYDSVNDPSHDLYKLGGYIFCFGAGFEIISIVNGVNKRKRMKEVVELYNQKIDEQ